MTIERFWEIVQQAHEAADGDMDAKCERLREALSQLPAAEVKSFSDHFDACEDRAYTWELWAAAYIIGGGCSDDAFSDFRATLISQGREVFERVLANPEALTAMELDEESAFFEGYQYVVNDVHEQMTGSLPKRLKPHPADPAGTPWEEDAVADLYPRLARKHGYAS